MTVSRRVGFFLAIVFVVIVASYGVTTFVVDKQNQTANTTNDILYKNSLQSCERGNKIREEQNARIPVHNLENDVLIKFLTAAQKAREAAYIKDKRPADQTAAKAYKSYVEDLKKGVKFSSEPLVDCKVVIKRPLRIDQ